MSFEERRLPGDVHDLRDNLILQEIACLRLNNIQRVQVAQPLQGILHRAILETKNNASRNKLRQLAVHYMLFAYRKRGDSLDEVRDQGQVAVSCTRR